MESQIVKIDATDWRQTSGRPEWTAAVEAGKVLYFPQLAFQLSEQEKSLLRPDIRDPKTRNISLNVDGSIKGVAGDEATRQQVAAMVGRFREQATALIAGLFPQYMPVVRMAPTSYRPSQVETRAQSWRADDKRMHVDAFPSRPNYGERILRVFTNVNPDGQPRVWRVGEPFEDVARKFLPRAKPYVRWQAKALQMLHVTKSLRSEYDHLMLQLHDGMKGDPDYQKNAPQETVPFAAGSTWVCFSDQAVHAVMAGQYMLEQTLFLPPGSEYDTAASPLAILTRLKGHPLV
ncbi:Kdo hydroxylase family protein [Comamonas sp. w2-DMI]|uniref:Kdo hydroxylase family protein n=1 Tax=Comamonas terrae TaxID=673548 RepID=A0ABW5URJ2_9BURK|nr:Kdo hydroxylase family protein [Comamonas terrae]